MRWAETRKLRIACVSRYWRQAILLEAFACGLALCSATPRHNGSTGAGSGVPRLEAVRTGAVLDVDRAAAFARFARSMLKRASTKTLWDPARVKRDSAAGSIARKEAAQLSRQAAAEARNQPGAVVAALRTLCPARALPVALDVAGYRRGAPQVVAARMSALGYRMVDLADVGKTTGRTYVNVRTRQPVNLLVVGQIQWIDEALVKMRGRVGSGPDRVFTLADIGYIASQVHGEGGGLTPEKLGEGWILLDAHPSSSCPHP